MMLFDPEEGLSIKAGNVGWGKETVRDNEGDNKR
jgi:hypothetical protein